MRIDEFSISQIGAVKSPTMIQFHGESEPLPDSVLNRSQAFA